MVSQRRPISRAGVVRPQGGHVDGGYDRVVRGEHWGMFAGEYSRRMKAFNVDSPPAGP